MKSAKGTRPLNKGVLRIAFIVQNQCTSLLLQSLMEEDNGSDDDLLDLDIVETVKLGDAKLKTFDYFMNLPFSILQKYGVEKTEADFEFLFHMVLSKYEVMDKDQLRHQIW